MRSVVRRTCTMFLHIISASILLSILIISLADRTHAQASSQLRTFPGRQIKPLPRHSPQTESLKSNRFRKQRFHAANHRLTKDLLINLPGRDDIYQPPNHPPNIGGRKTRVAKQQGNFSPYRRPNGSPYLKRNFRYRPPIFHRLNRSNRKFNYGQRFRDNSGSSYSSAYSVPKQDLPALLISGGPTQHSQSTEYHSKFEQQPGHNHELNTDMVYGQKPSDIEVPESESQSPPFGGGAKLTDFIQSADLIEQNIPADIPGKVPESLVINSNYEPLNNAADRTTDEMISSKDETHLETDNIADTENSTVQNLGLATKYFSTDSESERSNSYSEVDQNIHSNSQSTGHYMKAGQFTRNWNVIGPSEDNKKKSYPASPLQVSDPNKSFPDGEIALVQPYPTDIEPSPQHFHFQQKNPNPYLSNPSLRYGYHPRYITEGNVYQDNSRFLRQGINQYLKNYNQRETGAVVMSYPVLDQNNFRHPMNTDQYGLHPTVSNEEEEVYSSDKSVENKNDYSINYSTYRSISTEHPLLKEPISTTEFQTQISSTEYSGHLASHEAQPPEEFMSIRKGPLPPSASHVKFLPSYYSQSTANSMPSATPYPISAPKSTEVKESMQSLSRLQYTTPLKVQHSGTQEPHEEKNIQIMTPNVHSESSKSSLNPELVIMDYKRPTHKKSLESTITNPLITTLNPPKEHQSTHGEYKFNPTAKKQDGNTDGEKENEAERFGQGLPTPKPSRVPEQQMHLIPPVPQNYPEGSFEDLYGVKITHPPSQRPPESWTIVDEHPEAPLELLTQKPQLSSTSMIMTSDESRSTVLKKTGHSFEQESTLYEFVGPLTTVAFRSKGTTISGERSHIFEEAPSVEWYGHRSTAPTPLVSGPSEGPTISRKTDLPHEEASTFAGNVNDTIATKTHRSTEKSTIMMEKGRLDEETSTAAGYARPTPTVGTFRSSSSTTVPSGTEVSTIFGHISSTVIFTTPKIDLSSKGNKYTTSSSTIMTSAKRKSTSYPTFPSRQPTAIPNRIRGKAQVKCEEDKLLFSIFTLFPFTGQIFAQDRKRISECNYVLYDADKINITLPYSTCGIKNPGDQRAETQYHMQIIVVFEQEDGSTTLQSFMAQCVHRKVQYQKSNIPKRIEEALEELHLVPTKLEQKAIIPECHMRIIKEEDHDHGHGHGESDEEVNVVNIGQPMKIEWRLIPESDAYGFHVRNCTVRDAISGDEHLVIDERGCSTDINIFGHPYYDTYHDVANVHWHAFKVPDNNQLSIKCSFQICSDIADSEYGLTSCDSIPSPPFCPDLITSPSNSILFDLNENLSQKRFIRDLLRQHVHADICFGDPDYTYCDSKEYHNHREEHLRKLSLRSSERACISRNWIYICTGFSIWSAFIAIGAHVFCVCRRKTISKRRYETKRNQRRI